MSSLIQTAAEAYFARFNKDSFEVITSKIDKQISTQIDTDRQILTQIDKYRHNTSQIDKLTKIDKY